MLAKSPPEGTEWLHEIKYDGYRLGCRIDRGAVTLVTRNGNDWTLRFPDLRDAAARLPVKSAFIDGEVAIVLPDGRTSFQALQNALARGPRAALAYFVFDLLHLDGRDLSALPLEERKEALARLIERAGNQTIIRYSEHVGGNGRAVFEQACRLGLEGIVSKRRDLPHRAGRHDGWVKTKCISRQELVIGGFTDPEGSRPGLGALLVGYHDAEGRLVFAGKVGTGFTNDEALALRKRLERLEQREPPFDPRPPGSLGRVHWVRPQLVGEVTFAGWTADGIIRHPSFQGLREDKAPAEIVREQPAGSGLPSPPARGRMRLSRRRSRGTS